MESGELIAVLIVVIILIIGTIFLCFRCWKAIGEVADDHMKPKRETRAQMVRGAVRRSFRRAAGGIQRGAGHIRNSFRRARGLPPGVPPPEEPGPPGRPYGPRPGARRYPGRGAPGARAPAPAAPPGRGAAAPGPPAPVPSVSAQTPQGPGHSDLHPAYMPTPKPPEQSRQSDAPPTYQEALAHDITLVASHSAQVHSPPGRAHHHGPGSPQAYTPGSQGPGSPQGYQGPPGPQRTPTSEGRYGAAARDAAYAPQTPTSRSPPGGSTPASPSAPAQYPEPAYPRELAVPSEAYPQQGAPYTPTHGAPRSPYGLPNSPRETNGVPSSSEKRNYRTPEGYPAYPREGPGPSHSQSPGYDAERRGIGFSHLQNHPDQTGLASYQPETVPGYPATPQSGEESRSRDYPRDYTRSASHESGPRDYQRDYSRSASQDARAAPPAQVNDTGRISQRDFPGLMTSHPVQANEYTQPPYPVRSYSLQNEAGADDDGGFADRAVRPRRLQSTPAVPREYADYRAHPGYARSPGGEDVDYAGYSQIPASYQSERDPPYSPTASGLRGYENEAYTRDATRMRLPGDGGNPSSSGYLDVSQSGYSSDRDRGPLPPVPQRGESWGRYPGSPPQGSQAPPGPYSPQEVQYSQHRGVVFPDRQFADSDTFI